MPTHQTPDGQGQFADHHKKCNDVVAPLGNPRFDYSFNFIETGEHPQNFVLNDSLFERYRHYPKMESFVSKKKLHIVATNHPAMCLKCDPFTISSGDLKSHFDVILIEPPLFDTRLNSGIDRWDEIEQLPIDQLAAPRAFVWLWCESIEGLNRGRDCLKKWGFRRCEDICWIKTNKLNRGKRAVLEPDATFHRTKEHCLMGIKGTVKRSTDGDFIHANVDVDVILAEEDPDMPEKKPEELFNIIENFCLGRRRLHLFGKDHSVRPGWLTIGPNLMTNNFNADEYSIYFNQSASGHLTGATTEIENLRPKSPPPKESKQPVAIDPQIRASLTTIGSNSPNPNIAVTKPQLHQYLYQQTLQTPYLYPQKLSNNLLQQHVNVMVKQQLCTQWQPTKTTKPPVNQENNSLYG